MEEFELHSRYEALRDIPVPECFVWIFDVFIDLHYCSHDFVSYPDIDAWERVYRTKLTVYEVRLIRRMSVWAADEERKAMEDKD